MPPEASNTPDQQFDSSFFEESAEDLYEHAPCGYLSTLPDGLIVRVNRTFETMTGFRREDLVGQKRFVDILTVGGRIYHETHYAPLLQMQGSVRELAMDLVCHGEELPVLVSSVLKQGDDLRPAVIRVMILSARDRRNYERELLAQRRRAEESEAR
ncbi:MAG: PAS domain-containing protein, partial [Actinomycetota bacterium]